MSDYNEVRAVRWANPEQTAIWCEVDFGFLDFDFVPFTATASDATEYGPEIYARAIAGEFGAVGAYVAPSLPVPDITRGQCARELFERDMISGPEMIAMTATGAPPEFIATYFDMLPERERHIAYADFARGIYQRSNPLLNDTLSALDFDAAGIDEFFWSASTR